MLHPSNHLAYQQLHGQLPALPVTAAAKPFVASDYKAQQEELQRRLAAVPPEQRDILLGIYANPVISQLQSGQ